MPHRIARIPYQPRPVVPPAVAKVRLIKEGLTFFIPILPGEPDGPVGVGAHLGRQMGTGLLMELLFVAKLSACVQRPRVDSMISVPLSGIGNPQAALPGDTHGTADDALLRVGQLDRL